MLKMLKKYMLSVGFEPMSHLLIGYYFLIFKVYCNLVFNFWQCRVMNYCNCICQ